jgi:transcription termination/antitermination protein NusG
MTDESIPNSDEIPNENPVPESNESVETNSEMAVATAPESKKRWYVVKVQSGREESIKAALERRIKIDNLEEFVGRILIPTEKVVEMVRGKRVTKKRKKFPGYLMVEVEFNDKILYLFRETSGVGDFVGGSLHRIPAPMTDREVERMLAAEDIEESGVKKSTQDSPKVVLKFQKGDRVKVQSGTFAGMEGEVKEIIQPADSTEAPKVRVEVVIWNRPVSVEVEHWHVDPV